MNTPLISIILPTYNVANYIGRCLNSCLNQSFSNFEIIIVDDCGLDNSIEIASKYSEKDARIKIISNEKNLGTFHARKRGTLYAVGDYILYLDPDDELAYGALEKIALEIFRNPGLDMLIFNTQYTPDLKFWNVKPRVPVGTFKNNIAGSILKENNMPYGTMGKLYSRKVVMKGFDFLSVPESIRLVYGEDTLVFASALLNVSLVKGIAEKIYVYHLNETSITTQQDDTSLSNHIEQLAIVNRYLYELARHPNYSSVFESFNNRIEISKFFMESKKAKTNKEYLEIMIKIFSRAPSWRIAAKLMVFSINVIPRHLLKDIFY